jgi:ParB family chromosome partitioning protein
MSKQAQRPRLGRGLASLIAVTAKRIEAASPLISGVHAPKSPANPPIMGYGGVFPAAEQPALAVGKAMDVPLGAITPNPKQPRQTFNETGLNELAESMKANGVIQPIILRPAGIGKYQLVAGERRWRAAQKAGLKTIPAIVREVDNLTQAQLAMIENIQREDLNPIERALGYQTLVKEMGLTQAELAGRLGEDRSSIANFLRLLELTEPVREMVRGGKISAGHAKLLAGVPDILKQQKLADLVVSQGLSVRNLERILQEQSQEAPPKQEKNTLSPHLADVEKTLCRQLGLRVQLRASRERGKGRIVLHYGNLDQFDEIIDRLGVNLAND